MVFSDFKTTYNLTYRPHFLLALLSSVTPCVIAVGWRDDNWQFRVAFSQIEFMGSCVFCAPLDQYIGRHIDQQSTNVSVDTSVVYWLCIGVWVDMLTEMCRSIYRATYSTPWKYLPIYQGFAAADSQINTGFLPRQRRGMPKFYWGFAYSVGLPRHTISR